MSYKELIKTQLDSLKLMGKSRRDIEKDLKYSPKYLDQALSNGGSEKLLNILMLYMHRLEDQQSVLAEDPPEYLSEKQLIEVQKELISDLRTEKIKWIEDRRELQKKIDRLENQVNILIEDLKANSQEKSKHRRSG